ncbi:peptidoglycan-binding LysM domain protein [Apiospora saccharicola]|uniref:Peptidoglycan-binding LysM domain protein n=1 Tax=Apiospora saccharicola TaxID=335842 RepID=A0ABR1U1G8_9PEZI
MSTFAPQPEIPALSVSCDANSSYTVKKGDTCYAIARAYDLTPADILQANPQMSGSCDLLYIDQMICLPTGPATAPSATDTAEFSSTPIAHHTTISDQPTASSSDSSSPSSSAAADDNGCTLRHTVVAGDTCHDTWSKYKLSQESFMALNPHLSIRPDGYCGMAVGDVVCVAGPGSGGGDSDGKGNDSSRPKDPSDQFPKKMSALSVIPVSDDVKNHPTSPAAAERWLPVTFQTSTVRDMDEE